MLHLVIPTIKLLALIVEWFKSEPAEPDPQLIKEALSAIAVSNTILFITTP